MSKYDAALDMTYDNSAHTQILRNIKPNTTILEFGPASGVMTQYMKETLNCRVYIVEIDVQDYASAVTFAVDGVCGDAMTLAWKERFADISFDYVLFADILEHVYDPGSLIAHAMERLKDDGTLLLSVPNIAHNAVIIDLLRNKFAYRPLGLLDESHIRFFTYYSLMEMLDRVGLMPIERNATYIAPPHTEFKNDLTDVKGDLDALRCKDFDNVYQFVFATVKKSYYYENKPELKDHIIRNVSAFQGLLFFDTGNGFDKEGEPTLFRYEPGNVSITVDLPPNAKNILFYPANDSALIISHMRAITDGGYCHIECANGNSFREHFLFLVKDPYFIITLPPWPATWVRIECHLSFYNSKALSGLFLDFINYTGLVNHAENECRTNTAQLQSELAETNKALDTAQTALSNASPFINHEQAHQAAEYVKLLNTLSWRITRPLRWFRGLFSGQQR